MNNQHQQIDPTELERRWGSPLVSRDQQTLDRATGGLINAKTLANLDSKGMGPRGRLRMGRKVAYPSHEFFVWLVASLKPAVEFGPAVGEKGEVQGDA